MGVGGRHIGAALLLAGLAGAQGGRGSKVARCELTGTVDAGTAAYLKDCVETAERERYQALLVRLDTPGGALESTRDIARAFLGAQVPVVVWVGPSGARAGSAGVFITLAAHVAVMAEGTNIGAAHPVAGPTGADPEATGEEMGRKVVNDAVAFVRAIAEQRGRNADWAEKAVRESASVPAQQAVKLRVVDFIASSEPELLERLTARSLITADAELMELRPTFRQKLVHSLANPALAYILFLVGGLGLAIELSNPGMIAPGVIGLVCLVLALIAFSALPIRAGAVVLMVLGLLLIVGELFVTSGLLGLGGALLLVLGGLLFVDRFNTDWFVEPSFQLPLRLVVPTAVMVGGLATLVMVKIARSRRLQQQGADLGLINEQGRALDEVGPGGGEVFVHGERWRAKSSARIPQGGRVVVRRVEGLTLFVEETRT
ncbi:MAG: NfeD family protein [Myxococcota bacterium]